MEYQDHAGIKNFGGNHPTTTIAPTKLWTATLKAQTWSVAGSVAPQAVLSDPLFLLPR